ncbi:GerAB/ArcD/ProY family transporter [Oceanobacillus halophilus]|uniref:Spore gernimation protein n=1 Tax=Oceanobacillus halophilus TaxID=930130 RepID=A0A494ZTI0_9BACI|nr:GerAB/ArcD/ProY family transporter [Oceanobacillus halophilus]RKQ28645.1 spore gernimation protein [Oceanobacillus halophilus]
MDINVKVKENLQIRPFYLFFIITSIQIGIGILGFPKIVYQEALQDSWISILFTFFYIVAVVIVMFMILNQYKNADIYGIQVDIFGKWIGKILGTIYILYFGITLFSILITYMEVVRISIFPSISNLALGGLLLCLVVYSVLGGIRVVVGVCTLFFLGTQWLFLLLIQPAMEVDFTHLQPMFVTPFPDLLEGAKVSSYTFMGFELLLVIYPFIKNKKKAKLPTFLAVSWSTITILLLTMLVIGYFSHNQILRREWALLGLFKIQNFTFIERFDYVVVTEWMLVIITNMILLMWAMTYGMKRLYNISQKTTLYLISIILLIACIFVDEHFQIQKVIDTSSQIGLWIVYVYPFFLLPIVLFKKRKQRKKEKKHAK